MRGLIRGALVGLALGAAVLASCQRQATTGEDGPSTPTNAEREAEIAAETLAALGGPASAEQRALYEGEFQASGGIDALGNAEGAWELTLLEDYAQFSRPGLGEDGGIPGDRDYRERGMRVVAGPLTVTISQQTCTASGVELPYTAHVLFEGVAYQGCARRGVIEGERPTWASVLPELMPAIDTCLQRATSTPARVTFASALDEGEVLVRVREANATRRECIVTNGAVSVYEPLSDIDRRPGEGDPEFQPGAARPGARACRSVEPAIDRTGAQLGWLIRATC
ncbi:MAG: hypothetical protein AB7T59_09520 [Hyphomonadaceae bacterium]